MNDPINRIVVNLNHLDEAVTWDLEDDEDAFTFAVGLDNVGMSVYETDKDGSQFQWFFPMSQIEDVLIQRRVMEATSQA